MKVKICPECGATNSVDATFCTNCSNVLTQAQVIEKVGVQDQSDEHLNYEPERGRPPFVVILVMLVLVLVAIVNLVFFGLLTYTSIMGKTSDSMLALILALIATFMFLVSMLSFILLYGLRFAKKWAWKLAVVWMLFNIIQLLLQTDRDIADYFIFILTAIVFVLFMMPGTKMYFETYQEKKSREKLIFSVLTILTFVVLGALFFLFST